MMEGLQWYSWQWFHPKILESFEWANPMYFYGLWFIPIIWLVRLLLQFGFKAKLPVSLDRQYFKISFNTWARFVPPLIVSMVIALILTALARPQLINEKIEQWSEGIDIVLVIDISNSMQALDFKPNRLEAAKKVAKEFINGRLEDRIGLVVFSGEAYPLSPLTTDYDLLHTHIEDINFEMIQSNGTAIGSAIGVATNRMRDSIQNTKVLILLSDGESNAGLDPIKAAELAKAYGIKIYTIGVGKKGEVPYRDQFGIIQYLNNEIDEETLKEIAKIGDGMYFRVTNNQALEQVFSQIDDFEKTKIQETKYQDTNDYYTVYLRWGLILLGIWFFTKLLFFHNVLRD